MSFNLPSVKPKPEYGAAIVINRNLDANYQVPNLMLQGFAAISQNQLEHPLIQSEHTHHQRKQHLNEVVLRNTQGLHAPLRLNMELQSAKKVGHLPFLPRHNVMLESLTGRDLEIAPEDIFNCGEFPEMMGQPHAMVEIQQGIL